MYQKPDFVQISVKVEDVFANYLTTGCPKDGFAGWMYSGDTAADCEGKPGYTYVDNTLTGLGYAHMCYSSFNP